MVDAVAQFFAEPIDTDLPGYTFRAHVLGPSLIPVITDPAEATAHPELAVMSVMAHGTDPAVAHAFVCSLTNMKDEHALQYSEYCYAVAGPAVRHILEELMSSTTWPVYSPFAKEHYGKGMAEGRAEFPQGAGGRHARFSISVQRRVRVVEEGRLSGSLRGF